MMPKVVEPWLPNLKMIKQKQIVFFEKLFFKVAAGFSLRKKSIKIQKNTQPKGCGYQKPNFCKGLKE
jgi:hypothetical protein